MSADRDIDLDEVRKMIRDAHALATEHGGTLCGVVDPDDPDAIGLAALRVFEDWGDPDRIEGLGFVVTFTDGDHAFAFIVPRADVQRLIDDPLPMGAADA